MYGQSSIVLTSFFKALDFSDFQLGLFMTLTLLGDAAGSLLLTLYADGLGRAKVRLEDEVCGASVLMPGAAGAASGLSLDVRERIGFCHFT